MGKVSQHLEKVHSHLAAHHDTLAKCFGKLAGMSKAAKSEMEDGDLTENLSTIAATHESTAAFHKAMAGECKKAIEASDLEKNEAMEPLPAGLSRVVPERTSTIRAVPRTGAPQMPIEKSHAGNVAGIDFLGLEELDEI